MRGLIEPKDALQVVNVDLALAKPSNYLLAKLDGCPEGVSPLAHFYTQITCSGKSLYLRKKNLDHNLHKTSFTMPSVLAMALCTTAPTASSTGATLVEASYTGYAEKSIEAAWLNAASESESKTTNGTAFEFAACTSGSATVLGFALKDLATVGSGNVLYFGSLSSTVISTTATPASFEAGHLEVTEA